MIMKFELLKVDKITSLKIFSHVEARNIKFRQLVNLIQRVPLGTLPQEVVTSLPHIHMTLRNLLSVITKELLLSNLGSKNNFLIEIGHFSIGVVTSLPLDHVTLINLYISSCRQGTGATFVHVNSEVIIDFLF